MKKYKPEKIIDCLCPECKKVGGKNVDYELKAEGIDLLKAGFCEQIVKDYITARKKLKVKKETGKDIRLWNDLTPEAALREIKRTVYSDWFVFFTGLDRDKFWKLLEDADDKQRVFPTML